MNDFEFIKNKIQEYDYVSFDIFDTLLYRTVNQAYDQLGLIPILAEKKFGIKLNDFVHERTKSETKARINAHKSDVTLSMIYDYLPYSKEVCDKLKQLECEIEVKCCRPNVVMVDLLKWCQRQGKHIVIITDMYLPRPILSEMMTKIGVTYDRMFISSEEEATKNNGELFDIVITKLSITPKQIIHIGDNPINDIQRSRERGIESLLRFENKLPELVYGKKKTKSVSEQHIKNLIVRGLQEFNNNSPEIRIGYSIVGPMLYEFCEWLHIQKLNHKLDYLLFVAREGFLIKRCYDLMYPEDTSVTKYVRLNKNLLKLPLLSMNNPVESLVNGMIVCESYSWEMIFKFLRVDNAELILHQLKEKGIAISLGERISREDIICGKYDDVLRCLFQLQRDVILTQENLLIEYLKQISVINHKIGFINNSFNGNGQYMVESFMKAHGYTPNILGLQFYTRKTCLDRLHDRCLGFVTEASIPLYEKELIASSSLIFEHLMFEHNGTALFFKKDINFVNVICEQPRTEDKNYPAIDILQASALQFIRDAKASLIVPLCGWGFYSFYNFLKKPLKEDALFVGNIWDDDDDVDRQIIDTKNPQSYLSILKFEKRNDWPIGSLVCQDTNYFLQKLFYTKWLFSLYIRSIGSLFADCKFIFN